MALSTCPGHDALREFRLGKLPADEAGEIAEHLDTCASCQANIETISDTADTLVHSLRQPAATEFDAEPDLQKALAAIEAFGASPPLPSVGNAHRGVPADGGLPTSSSEANTKVDAGALGALRDYQLLEELGVYWFDVNRNFGPRMLRKAEAHPAKNFVASCHEGLSLWRQNRSGERSGAKECFAPTPVSAPGAALGSHLCVALSSVQVV